MQSPERARCSDIYGDDERRRLREVARASIDHGLRSGAALSPDPRDYAPALRAERATFVTLRRKSNGELRGCVGGLEARLPLVSAVAQSAFNAAFHDPRFPALTSEEFPDLDIHLSVLSPLEAIEVNSERELCQRLRPGVDGLVLADGAHSATFLPDVWESLPEPARFVGELKRKAGWSPAYWSPSMRVQLYTSESF